MTVLAEPPRRVDPRHDTRPLFSAGGLGATWAAGLGLAILITLTLVGWVAAPHPSVGQGLPSVFRTAVQVWLVAHQTGFTMAGTGADGSIGLLPLGLVVLPGLLLYRSGRWLARGCELPRLRHAGQAALAIAGPYAAIAGTLALIARTPAVQPSVFQALMAGFIVAFAAAGLGVTRELAAAKNIPWSRLLALIPERPRSIVAGTVAAVTVLLFFGTALFLIAYAWHLPQVVEITSGLAPGPVGGALLILLQLAYLPNAVIFAMAYAIGPGFAVGADTIVAPTGVVLGALPQFPMLAALPESGPAPAMSLLALAAPFVAGAVGGVFTIRSAPTFVSEVAPVWGFACGVATGLVSGLIAASAGGPLGGLRLATVGPSPWQVAVVAALEVGVSAAIAAWTMNWLVFRRDRRAAAQTDEDPGPLLDDEDDAPDPDSDGLYGITYEADVPAPTPATESAEPQPDDDLFPSARTRTKAFDPDS